jgi:quercetin dioxygenase-like cupin family protein
LKLRHIAPVSAALLLAGFALAQNPGIQRTIVTRGDVSKPNCEAVIASVTIAPGSAAGRHTHAGEEITYIMEGEMDVIIEGQPTQHLKAGQGFIIPNGAKHDAKNTGTVPVKLAAVYYVEKGKPLATPAP